MDLLAIEPHKISRDLSGYITYIYGAAKIGKTTLAAQAPNCLLLAAERGYNALNGVIPQDITSWSEMKKVYRELKKPEVQERFKVLVVDTIDLFAKYCTKYICASNGVEDLSELPYGRGYALMRAEFEDVFNGLAQLGYAIIFIGHDEISTVTEPDGREYNVIVPALSPAKVRAIIANMADLYGYAHSERNEQGQKEPAVLTLRDNTGMITCGTRFKYMRSTIPFSYDSLVEEIGRAIDAEAERGAEIVNEAPVLRKNLNFDELTEEFNGLVANIHANVSSEEWEGKWGAKITYIVEKTLGHGNKVSQLTPAQVEQLDVIVSELKEAVGEGL